MADTIPIVLLETIASTPILTSEPIEPNEQVYGTNDNLDLTSTSNNPTITEDIFSEDAYQSKEASSLSTSHSEQSSIITHKYTSVLSSPTDKEFYKLKEKIHLNLSIYHNVFTSESSEPSGLTIEMKHVMKHNYQDNKMLAYAVVKVESTNQYDVLDKQDKKTKIRIDTLKLPQSYSSRDKDFSLPGLDFYIIANENLEDTDFINVRASVHFFNENNSEKF